MRPGIRRRATIMSIAGEGLARIADRARKLRARYAERLAEAGVEPSVGGDGDSHGNALAQTIDGLYKAELSHGRRPWRSCGAAGFATQPFVGGFDNRRLLEPVVTIPLVEERYDAMLSEPAMAASINRNSLLQTGRGSVFSTAHFQAGWRRFGSQTL